MDESINTKIPFDKGLLPTDLMVFAIDKENTEIRIIQLDKILFSPDTRKIYQETELKYWIRDDIQLYNQFIAKGIQLLERFKPSKIIIRILEMYVADLKSRINDA